MAGRAARGGAGDGRVPDMLTISSGHSASYLLDAVATGRENYYTGAVAAGEPPGRWYGRGAKALGLRGLVDHQDMTALYERYIDPRDERFRDPTRWDEASTLGHTGRRYLSEDELYERALDAEPDASAERRAELRLEAGKLARRNVAFIDLTFNVPKSVTVMHTAFEAQEHKARLAGNEDLAEAWAAHRRAVEDAIWAGNNAALGYMADRAGYSRIGHHGGTAGRWADAHDWVVASFFQHDSRDHDPHLHVHNAVLNRVEGPDGTWRTLDGRSLYRWRPAASAVGERTMVARLTRSLGVLAATRPDGKSREIVGVSEQAMELFSSRRRQITPKSAELAAAFEAKFGRAPNSLELVRLAKQATFATRRAKSHTGETREEMLERWDAALRAEIDGGLTDVADSVVALAAEQPTAPAWSPRAVIETALADVQRRKAAWYAPDLTRAISDALPDHLGDLSDEQIVQVLDSLTETALEYAALLTEQRPAEAELPDELRLANGDSAYRAPGSRLYATPEHVHSERVLVDAAAQAGAAALPAEVARRFVEQLAESGIELGADQAAAVRGVLTSGARIESLVGPAGTGKSFVVGALARAWQDPELSGGPERRVFGLAASQIATDVLSGEGLRVSNIARWLGAQDRLRDGRPSGEDAAWRLRRDDLVVIDESAMAATADLAAVHRHVEAAGAKLLLVGDHRQLAAVGAGGGMELLATAGASYELAEARRFVHDWERAASLRLREADETVLGEYHKHGRLLDAGTAEQAEASAARAWLADTLAGRHALLVVDTNEQAARLSAALRAELVRLGRVREEGVPLGLQGTFAGVGDVVQARLNGWNLAGFEGNRRGPINRETYRVLDTRADGGLVVAPIVGRDEAGEQPGERMTLPGSYVAGHVALGYASTAHAGQGLTVDTSHAVVTRTTGADAFYVGMSRGRHANTPHVATLAVPEDPAQGRSDDAVHRSPAAVLAGVLERAETSRSALATAAESAEENRSVRTPAELLEDAIEIATAGRTARWLDRLVDDELLTPRQRATLAAEDGASTLSRLLRRVELAGRDPEQVLRAAVAERDLDDARQLTNVLHHRITGGCRLDPIGDSFAERVPRVEDPGWQRYLDTLAAAADERRIELGAELAENPPQWAVEALGAPPAAGQERGVWERRAGTAAAHRELTGHDDEATALGAPPKAGQTEAYPSWRAAWRALGRPEADRDELELSDGQLRLRVRAYEREKAWAPRYVANELAAIRQTAERHRATAALRTAEAAAAGDADRTRLEREGADAAALAEVLDTRAAELELADQARSRWLVHTAATRAMADRASAELNARKAEREAPEPEVTAEEWLAAHAAAMCAEDPHREITDEAELVDAHEPARDRPEAPLQDVREIAAGEPPIADEDVVRVPSGDETAETIRRAQRALREIEEREAADAAREQDERADQLTRWHLEDRAVEQQAEAELDDGAPAMEMGGWR
jgi:conjugative relaxase-like TrwC/TraI family protein